VSLTTFQKGEEGQGDTANDAASRKNPPATVSNVGEAKKRQVRARCFPPCQKRREGDRGDRGGKMKQRFLIKDEGCRSTGRCLQNLTKEDKLQVFADGRELACISKGRRRKEGGRKIKFVVLWTNPQSLEASSRESGQGNGKNWAIGVGFQSTLQVPMQGGGKKKRANGENWPHQIADN